MSFDISQTIQSQYAASPRITSLVTSFYSLINPYPDIKLFYDKVFNFQTAEGYGLDVWGRIVGIDRKIKGVPTSNDYLGFLNRANDAAVGFDQAPFYSTGGYQSGTYILADEAYRLLINTKAMANVGTGTLADLNRQLHHLLPNANACVLNVGVMKIRILVKSHLYSYEKNLLLRGDLPPIPCGVGFEIYQLAPKTFGFRNSGLQPFNCGIFALNRGKPLNVNY